MKHAAFVLLLIPGDLAIFIAGWLLSSRFMKPEAFNQLSTWQRLIVANIATSGIGIIIIAWSALLFWLLW